ncbi:FAD-dependent oxidoreductase [Novosphingobium sp. FKTRR1]|uniref:FAD-dependent oxidoreductase n=1 Tax=Novosphingobium sp. FKTRR1 TaxID=2879118 RepID=UPI001CF004D5|nr:FAD-dependent oxidoreductase [Novosphingobium sp. FKTRR1]
MSISKQPLEAITRRDFIQGAAVGSAAAAGLGVMPGALHAQGPSARPALAGAAGEPNGYYPPLRQGMRGSHPGSFEIAHALRDGEAVGQALAGPAEEAYDLVIVGGGISGLSAARFYADRQPGARILILENHDDFGGHAKRNEFRLPDGRIALMNGGTAGIESPTPYSPVADGLLRRLDINVPDLIEKYGEVRGGALTDAKLGGAVFFDKEGFGRDHLAKFGAGQPDYRSFADAPISAAAKAQIAALEEGRTDPIAHLAPEKRKLYLSTISYRTYLEKHGRLGPDAIKLYQNRPLGWWCVGADGISALDAWGAGLAGFKSVTLPKGGIARMGYTPRGFAETGGSYDFHFPDGNATIARLLVASLIPGFMPAGTGAVASVLAPTDYTVLDRDQNKVRLRLSSTVLRVENRVSAGADIVYARGGQVRKVAARHVVMACWNMIIPYLVPSLPAPQKEALHELVKEPLVYVSVLLNNWRALAKAGVGTIQFPTGYYQNAFIDRAVEIGGYAGPKSVDDPVLMQFSRIPHAPGLSEHDQSRAGRAELLGTDFATFEDNLVDLLTRTVGPYGFDARKDIGAVIVNRWPHGYSPEYNPLWDKQPDGPNAPNVIGRRKFGAIAIANADSARAAYTDAAIDMAHRAVGDLLG